ncbi:flagellar basal body-associated FliL family protein [Rhodocaloribacter litoris]|uniref:flagellar basal body-associated FliL family protein n=1 Tax=Rhodocaloribacter litoris TaxID=2558931 RepID=UPI001E58AB59|nr:flagellar basal body-associated FliL family protein [Rhodocaloribacter litoris]QXD16061.1 flagellar basal body-associated FliL family protein [Rhodocaloribacter litoris]GIV59792.1 MAG: hypothetical protein KatS3mg043_0881 [Rhodothermaceae bacterium]
MAEEIREQDAPAGAEEDPVKEKKGGKSFLLLLLPLLVLSLAGGGWIAFNHYSSLVQAAEIIGRDFSSGEKPKKEEPIQYGHFRELQGLIVNPSDSEGRRFLMLNIGLEAAKEKVLSELEQKDVVVRDTILRLLSRRTVSELSDISLREEIKQELLTAINEIVQDGKVDRLYFTQYVLQ